jgi:hypothetical protein
MRWFDGINISLHGIYPLQFDESEVRVKKKYSLNELMKREVNG